MNGRALLALVRRDRGSVSVWLVMVAVFSLARLALLVDGGGAMVDKVRVADMAEQAARAAADDVNTANLRANGTVTLAGGYCQKAQALAASYAASSQLDLISTTCPPAAPAPDFPELVSVTVSVRFTPVFPLIFGDFTVTSTQSATVFCGNYNEQVQC
jgi:Flp pilus assembly protein TadG